MENITAKSNSRIALGIFGRTIIAAVIGLFLYLSLSTIFTTFSTEKIGFAIYKNNDDGTTTLVKKYLYTDKDYNEDIKVGKDQTVITLYSDVPAGVALTLDIVAQIGALVALAGFPYAYLWSQGDHDRNETQFGHRAQDAYRGLKVGFLADIPAILVYAFLWLGKLGVPGTGTSHAVFTLFNGSFLPFCYRVMGRNLTSASQIPIGSMLLLLLPVLFLPLVCHVAYTLGLHQFSISDKLFYKHKKKHRKKR